MPSIRSVNVRSLDELGKTDPAKFYKLFAEHCPDAAREAMAAVRAELGEEWFAEVAGEGERKEAERWDGYYRRTYGITLADYEAMWDRQAGRCAICRTDEPGRTAGRLVVDHCHCSGRVRALLCCGCNTLVGFLETRREHVEPALEYIRHHG